MKSLVFVLLILVSTVKLNAQNIENPSFDSVYIGGIDRIFDWITSDVWPVGIGDTVSPLTPNSQFISVGLQYHELIRSVQLEYTAAFDGPLAIQLFSDTSYVDIFGNPFPGFIVNGNNFYTDSTGYIDLNKCGMPFSYRPDKLRGHYQYEDHSPSMSNYPHASLLLKKFNQSTQQSDTVGYGTLSMQFSPISTWQLFEMPIIYLNNLTPDSIVVAFVAPRLAWPAIFKIDSLGFEYSSVNIQEQEYKSKVQYYIDDNYLRFDNIEEIASIKLYNYLGKEVLRSHARTEIDLSAFGSGIYILSLEMKNGLQKNLKIYY